MNTFDSISSFIDRKTRSVAVEYDEPLQHSYMVGVLESALVCVLDFIEIRYGEEAKIEAMKQACIVK